MTITFQRYSILLRWTSISVILYSFVIFGVFQIKKMIFNDITVVEPTIRLSFTSTKKKNEVDNFQLKQHSVGPIFKKNHDIFNLDLFKVQHEMYFTYFNSST